MKFRILYVVVPLALVLTATLLTLALLNRTPSTRQTSDLSQASLDDPLLGDYGSGITVLARRAISIPFGIVDSLPLSADGQVIHVSGHGECPAGAETFKLNVQVSQDSTRAPATGRTEGACPGGSSITWSAEAVAPGPIAFAQGSALACGQAVIHFDKEGALTFKWCKPVTLE